MVMAGLALETKLRPARRFENNPRTIYAWDNVRILGRGNMSHKCEKASSL
jgi:hypothetical protein